ncbi:hypothetical protein GCM10007939_23330 [Amylibacter marinus]|uniref:Uncharacterized protein n=1 Tax=Amylibacter marinus TaxID=1475483 RepID=A0ABQ5VY28_9RHOB|nr:hypothetical protein GCM10007939_23330 [Amylibacter marinus]
MDRKIAKYNAGQIDQNLVSSSEITLKYRNWFLINPKLLRFAEQTVCDAQT